MDMTEKTVSRKVVHEGKITTYIVEDVLLPNGKTAQREIVRHDAASAVLPFIEDGKALFVKQFRKPVNKAFIEIPAGLINSDETDPLVAAKRELEEETGCQAENWTLITSFYSSPGFTDEYLTIYEANGLRKMKHPLPKDEDEFLEVVELSFDEAWQYYEEKVIRDAKTVFALFYWKQKLAEK